MKKIAYMFRIYSQLSMAVFIVVCAGIQAAIGYLSAFPLAYYPAGLLAGLALVMVVHAVLAEIAYVKRWA